MNVAELEAFELQPNEASEALRVLYETGVGLANDTGDLVEAHAVFREGLLQVPHVPAAENTPAVQLLHAQLLREDGFTAQEHRVLDGNPELMPDPVEQLAAARQRTEALLDLPKNITTIYGFQVTKAQLLEAVETNQDLAHLISEHGATLGGIARLALRALVDDGILREDHTLTKYERARAHWDTRDFGRAYAHGFLKLGNNAYYRTSNAMNGMRAELAIGGVLSVPDAAVWAGRAVAGIAFSITDDHENFVQSVNTTGRIGRDTRMVSRNAAIASIRNHF